jgi:hypothetical protein
MLARTIISCIEGILTIAPQTHRFDIVQQYPSIVVLYINYYYRTCVNNEPDISVFVYGRVNLGPYWNEFGHSDPALYYELIQESSWSRMHYLEKLEAQRRFWRSKIETSFIK